jgi:hypothetical protein
LKLYLSHYKLDFRDTEQAQEGCLIKVVDGDFFGVADICPKTQFGDQDCDEQLSSKGPLFQRALELALEDFSARSEKRSLQKDLPIQNNILITDLSNFDFSKIVVSPDEKNFKIKYSGQVDDFAKKLNQTFKNTECKLRLDFNAKLEPYEFETFINQLDRSVFESIEYIEDPTEFCEKWFKWNREVPIAVDFQKPKNPDLFEKARQELYFIFKPAREKPDVTVKNYSITSSMDHPVGVAHALRIAQNISKNVSGLLTLDLFKPTAFDSYFSQNEEWLNFSKSNMNEYGIGMTEELNQLNWILFEGKIF